MGDEGSANDWLPIIKSFDKLESTPRLPCQRYFFLNYHLQKIIYHSVCRYFEEGLKNEMPFIEFTGVDAILLCSLIQVLTLPKHSHSYDLSEKTI